ncbi:mitochondrial CIV assembly protein Cox17 [Andalucia godoyi]|uniref:Mitochondrial CIV assembly protein Cox17 n=1 Tax=Andalucia godoyi TaxID=505711 RepID=A0A8K0AI01_ANDGO|nr:mitochondrial CIV assembly protein Cox17 [Andalucia godoyi]|eukprot:ANDGO_08782.mRNA.1 mitochondrial CIV assembly protein Cox17
MTGAEQAPKKKGACCVCKDMRSIRDECMITKGDEKACSKEIEALKACLRSEGFDA